MFSSCLSNYTENRTILKAEKLLNTSPDSAYSLLIGIKNPEKLSKADYAAWCLHYTHAMYKLQKKIESDNLIQISIKYYSNGSLPKYSGTAWYLLGCINSLHNKKPEAVSAFKRAEDILKNSNENKLNGLVAFNIGYTSMQDELYSHSLSYFRKSLKYFDEESKEKFIPFIIETSAGASRSFMAFLVDAYYEEEVNGEVRSVLRFHPKLSPIKAAVFPLVNKDGMPEISRKIEKDLRKYFKVFYDDKGAVGRRYRRQDEAGTPFCITVDTQTLTDQSVTVRERDSMQQVRLNADSISSYLLEKIAKS